jgi:hypothetical protein
MKLNKVTVSKALESLPREFQMSDLYEKIHSVRKSETVTAKTEGRTIFFEEAKMRYNIK